MCFCQSPVCLLNNTGYQCRCEDQYFWPCTTCSAYGHCDNIINVTCGCISGFPNDGQFCQPMTELTSKKCFLGYITPYFRVILLHVVALLVIQPCFNLCLILFSIMNIKCTLMMSRLNGGILGTEESF